MDEPQEEPATAREQLEAGDEDEDHDEDNGDDDDDGDGHAGRVQLMRPLFASDYCAL